MASVEATLDRILEAVRRLPEPQRRKLLQDIEALPRSEQALAAAQRLRGKYRMGSRSRQRMSDLLNKGNAGSITSEERKELDLLVEAFEAGTLALAQAVTNAVTAPPSPLGERPARS